jgi:hypothetical protein
VWKPPDPTPWPSRLYHRSQTRMQEAHRPTDRQCGEKIKGTAIIDAETSIVVRSAWSTKLLHEHAPRSTGRRSCKTEPLPD